MKFTLLGILAFLLAANSTPLTQGESGTSLQKIEMATKVNEDWVEEPTSIGDHIFHVRLTCNTTRGWPVLAVFNLDGKYSQLRGMIGIQDKYTEVAPNAHYKISLDGSVVSEGSFSASTRSKAIDIDLTKASALRVELDQCVFADPMLYQTGTTYTLTPRLIEPADKASLSGTISLQWSAVEGATAYGVDIIVTSLQKEDDAADRLFSFTVRGGKTRLDLSAGKLPAGKFRWSVIAFNSKKNLGDFSDERSFSVNH